MFNSKNYVHAFFIALVGSMLFGLSACHDELEDATIQVIHASPDAPLVNVLADGRSLANSLTYASATGISTSTTLVEGNLNLNIQGLLPDRTTPSVIGPLDLELGANTNTLIIAANNVANIEPLVITREDVEVAENRARVRVIHAAPDAPQVDIYVTAPDADLANSSSTVTAAFQDDSGELDLASGDYQIRITPAGSQTIVFDSGTITIASGSDLVIVAIENTLTGTSPVNLLNVARTGGTLIQDVSAPAELRVIHASPDAPAVDVIANDAFTAPVVSNLAFSNSTAFLNLAPAAYNLKVVATGETTPVVIDTDQTLVAGASYSVYASGLLGSTTEPEAITALPLVRNTRRVATEAKIDIVHASPAAGNVDIYVTEPGASIDDLNPNFTNVTFRASTNFVRLVPGSYDITVTANGSKDAAIGPVAVTFAGGGIYTAIARDSVRTTADPDGLPLDLILLDDFVTP